MKNLIRNALLIPILLMAAAQGADVKISQLPLGSAGTAASTDSFPYVDATNSVTKRLKLSDLVYLPAFNSPTFPGTVTAGQFSGPLNGAATSFSGHLWGDVDGTQVTTHISTGTVTGKPITGFVSGAGSVSASDTILSAIDKLDGNIAGKQATGNYITALTGDVSASGPGSVSSTIQSGVVSNSKLATMATQTIKGNSTGGTAAPSDLSVSTVNTLLGDILADGSVAFTGNQSLGSHKLTSVTDPTSAQDASTKNYVDTQLSYLNPADAVYAASTANIVGTYTNAVAGVCIGDIFTITATGALSLDGTSPAVGARILLKNQSSAFQNGVWTVTVAGSLGVSPVLTRALDFNSAADMNSGQIIPIINGTVNAGASYYQTATISTCSSDSQTWTQFQKAASAYVQVANNLSDVASASTSFNNISGLTTLGDLIYGGASGTRTRLAGDTSNTRKFLREVSSGGVAAAPAWDTVVASDIASGQIAVANGGTGAATLTLNSVLLGNGTSSPQMIAPGTSGNVLTSDGTTWASSTPASGPQSIFLVGSTASGTNGGSGSTGSWLTRTINGIVNPSSYSWASLASNQFTLTSGTYIIRGYVIGYGDRFAARLQNITNGAPVMPGMSMESGGCGAQDGGLSTFLGQFTIASTIKFEIQEQVQTACSGFTLGSAVGGSFAVLYEVFVQIEIQKIS